MIVINLNNDKDNDENSYDELIIFLPVATKGASCRFPRDWKGRWYQSGLGEVAIRHTTMDTKGVCRQHQRDYFLLYNR